MEDTEQLLLLVGVKLATTDIMIALILFCQGEFQVSGRRRHILSSRNKGMSRRLAEGELEKSLEIQAVGRSAQHESSLPMMEFLLSLPNSYVPER